MEKWTIETYWFERPEDAHSIRRRVEHLLRSLAIINPELSRWATRPHKGKRLIPFDGNAFEDVELNRRGRYRGDTTGLPNDEMGFYAELLTPGPPGLDDFEYSLIRLRAGAYGLQTSMNRCEIRLHNGSSCDALQTVQTQCEILRALVEAWEPDAGIATSIHFLLERQAQRRLKPERVPEVGWLTYLPARRGPVPPLAAPAWTVPLRSLGTIVVASPERVSVSRPETIAAVDAVDAQLAQAGLLEPEPPHTEAFLPQTLLS